VDFRELSAPATLASLAQASICVVAVWLWGEYRDSLRSHRQVLQVLASWPRAANTLNVECGCFRDEAMRASMNFRTQTSRSSAPLWASPAAFCAQYSSATTRGFVPAGKTADPSPASRVKSMHMWYPPDRISSANQPMVACSSNNGLESVCGAKVCGTRRGGQHFVPFQQHQRPGQQGCRVTAPSPPSSLRAPSPRFRFDLHAARALPRSSSALFPTNLSLAPVHACVLAMHLCSVRLLTQHPCSALNSHMEHETSMQHSRTHRDSLPDAVCCSPKQCCSERLSRKRHAIASLGSDMSALCIAIRENEIQSRNHRLDSTIRPSCIEIRFIFFCEAASLTRSSASLPRPDAPGCSGHNYLT
jgi:hypothetical protein